jgi:hypothetical protein
MAISRNRILYVAVMLAAGVAIGLVVTARPGLRELFLAPVVWPFVLSLILELILRAANRKEAEPVTMGDRVVGVLGAGLIIAVIMDLKG